MPGSSESSRSRSLDLFHWLQVDRGPGKDSERRAEQKIISMLSQWSLLSARPR
jgi:hypothetical protein